MVPKQTRGGGGGGLGNKALNKGQKQVRRFFVDGDGLTARSRGRSRAEES